MGGGGVVLGWRRCILFPAEALLDLQVLEFDFVNPNGTDCNASVLVSSTPPGWLCHPFPVTVVGRQMLCITPACCPFSIGWPFLLLAATAWQWLSCGDQSSPRVGGPDLTSVACDVRILARVHESASDMH